MSAADTILSVIDGTRRRMARAGRAGGAAYLAATALGSLSVLALLFGFLPGARGFVYLAAGVKILFASTLAAGVVYFSIKWFRTPDRHRTALALEEALPFLKNDLVVSYELVCASGNERNVFSRELAAAHVERAARRLAGVDTSRVVPTRHVVRGVAAALMAALAAGITFHFWPGAFRSAASYAISGRLVPTADIAAPARPQALVLGDISIRYEFPAYTDKEPVGESNTDGSIKALKGSVAHFEARSSQPVAKASVRLGDSGIAARVKDYHVIQADIPLLKDGAYRIVAEGPDGEPYAENRTHRIEIVKDSYPEIKLVRPREDTEVREAGVLELEFYAGDDFGISRVDVVYWLGGEEGRITAVAPGEGTKEVSGVYNWDISAIGVEPGDRVRYYMEVYDNDEVSGSKKAVSSARALEVYSPLKKHRKIVDRQWELLLDMVALLADVLENELPGRGLLDDERMNYEREIAASMDKLIEGLKGVSAKMEDDPYADYATDMAIKNIASDLEELRDNRRAALDYGKLPAAAARDLKEKETPVLERGVIALDKALKRQRAADVVATGEEILKSQRAIGDLLEKAKSGDRQALEQLEKEIRRMQQAMRDLMEAMSRGARTLPDEFLNADAMKNLPLGKTGDLFQALQNAVRDGNIEDALDVARKMQDVFARMMASMESGMASFGQSSMGREFEELGDMVDQLAEVRQEQREIYGEAQKIGTKNLEDLLENQKTQLEKVKKELEKLLDEFRRIVNLTGDGIKKIEPPRGAHERNRFHRHRSEIQGQLYWIGKKFDYSREMMEQDDFYSLRMLLNEWKGRVESIRESAGGINSLGPFEEGRGKTLKERSDRMSEILEEMLGLLENSLGERERALSGKNRERLKELAGRQEELRGRTSELEEKLEALREKLPMLGGAPSESCGRARDSMGKARDMLGEFDPEGSLGPQAGALRELDQALESLKGMRESMRSAMAGGMPMPMFVPGGSGSGRGGGGYQVPGKFVPGKVEIPGRTGYKVPEKYRREILKAMRHGTPQEYKELVRDYYKKLVE